MLLRACKNQLILQKHDFRVVALWALGAVVLAEAITHLVMILAKPDSYFMLSPFLLYLIAGFMGLILSFSYWVTIFPMGLSMGATRREMVASTLCLTTVMNLMLYAFVALDWLLERVVGVGYWVNVAGKALEEDPIYIIPWWTTPLVIVGCSLVAMLLGTMVLRFGRKGFWVLWAIWMAICFVPQLMPEDFSIPFIGTPLWSALPYLTVVVVLFLSAASVRTLLRLPVREQ